MKLLIFSSAFLKDIDRQKDIIICKDPESHIRKRAVLRLQHTLIQAQEVGDEKLQIAQQVCDMIENRARQLDLDCKLHDMLILFFEFIGSTGHVTLTVELDALLCNIFN